jgi:hypothetical protein
MNTTVVQQALTGSSGGQTAVEALRTATLGAWVVVLIALPGYFLAIATIDRIGRWWLQVRGARCA